MSHRRHTLFSGMERYCRLAATDLEIFSGVATSITGAADATPAGAALLDDDLRTLFAKEVDLVDDALLDLESRCREGIVVVVDQHLSFIDDDDDDDESAYQWQV